MAVPIIPLALAAWQIGSGIAKTVKAKKQEKEARNYRPPAEDRAAANLAKMEYLDPEMPGQQRIEDNIALISGNALAASREAGSLSENIATIASEENKAIRNLGIASAQDQKGDLYNYQQQLGIMGNKRDRQFQINKFAPYAQNFQEGRDMFGAGVTNISNAFQEDEISDKSNVVTPHPEELGIPGNDGMPKYYGSAGGNNLMGNFGFKDDNKGSAGGIGFGYGTNYKNKYGLSNNTSSVIGLALSKH